MTLIWITPTEHMYRIEQCVVVHLDSPQVEETLRSQNLHEPRYVFMDGNCKHHIKLVGGNSLGIFVAENKSNQDGGNQEHKSAGLKEGDRILEYNK